MATGVLEVPYEDRLVALIDVLGWKSLISASPDNCPQEALEALDRLDAQSRYDKDRKEHIDPHTGRRTYSQMLEDPVAGVGYGRAIPDDDQFRVTVFSDTVLISGGTNVNALEEIIRRVVLFSWGMLARGRLVRGAIVRGRMHHDDKHAVGPALVCAASMEKRAQVPRILVDAPVQDALLKQGWHAFLDRDRDGLVFYSFVRHAVAMMHEFYPEPRNEKIAVLRKMRDVLAARIQPAVSLDDVASKNYWMAQHFDSAIATSTYGADVDRIAFPATNT